MMQVAKMESAKKKQAEKEEQARKKAEEQEAAEVARRFQSLNINTYETEVREVTVKFIRGSKVCPVSRFCKHALSHRVWYDKWRHYYAAVYSTTYCCILALFLYIVIDRQKSTHAA